MVLLDSNSIHKQNRQEKNKVKERNKRKYFWWIKYLVIFHVKQVSGEGEGGCEWVCDRVGQTTRANEGKTGGHVLCTGVNKMVVTITTA